MVGAFDLSTPRPLLAKLSRELDRLQAAPNDVDHAFNFFVTAEHMLDWLHPGHSGKAKARREDIRKSEVTAPTFRSTTRLPAAVASGTAIPIQ
jgi:hypothetical protein